MRKFILIMVVALSGCVAQARLPPSYFAEEAPALDAGHVSVTAAGGGGASFAGDGGGLGGRVRVGIGGHQEIGVEASQVEIERTYDTCAGDQCLDGPSPTATYDLRSRSALLTWKRSYGEHYALVVGLGGSEHATVSGSMQESSQDNYGHSLDAAVAFIASQRVNDMVGLYAGGRATFAAPVGADNPSNANDVFAITGAVGLASHLGDNVRLFTEVGALVSNEGLDVTAVLGVTLKL